MGLDAEHFIVKLHCCALYFTNFFQDSWTDGSHVLHPLIWLKN